MAYLMTNDGDIDDFFNFREIKPKPKCQSNSSIHKSSNPIEKIKREIPKAPRDLCGMEYVKNYQINLDNDLSQTLATLNLTGMSSALTADHSFDDSALFETNSFVVSENIKKDLPIFKYREEIIMKVRRNPIVIICGPTGCGKSTQVPQYIFDDPANCRRDINILISQPRKIAAITVAQRVAQERNQSLGTQVGYQVGLNRCINLNDESTQMTFCTTGVILQKLISQKTLCRYSHIILDEVHERDLEIDFLLTIIRRLQPMKSNTKIILMSATMDVHKFQDFWKVRSNELENDFMYPPIIDLDQNLRRYDIVERYLDDIHKIEISPDIINPKDPGISNEMYTFAVQLILLILRSKVGEKQSILIFLPGLHEIERLQSEFYANDNMSKIQKFDPEFYILHSSLSMEEQKTVFMNSKSTKIILSTNIAESSITIPNVNFVIDFCLTKHLKSHKGSQMSHMVLDWATKNNCKQRAGRTGRVAKGTVYRLVFKEFFRRNLLEYPIPEMQLAPLESIIVKIKEFNMGAPLEIFALTLDPPDESAIVNAILCLKEHGALSLYDKNGNFNYHDGDFTYLGELMAALPCDVRLTKLIILGYLYSVLEEAIIIAAGLTFKGIFLTSLTNRMEAYCCKVKWSHGTGSDCLATFYAYSHWFEHYKRRYFRSFNEERDWCRENGLDMKNLHEMRIWIDEIKKRLHFYKIENLPHPNQPLWSQNEKVLILKVVMAGAFGSANYFITNTQIDMEKDAFQMFGSMDAFRTVYCRNMDRSTIGDVYKKQLKRTLVAKGVCNDESRININFDSGSERVFISFDENNEDLGFSSGYVAPEVYKAVKLSKLEGKIRLAVMTPQETLRYAESQGFGGCERNEYQIQYPYIKYPQYWPYPTRSTSTMKGFITHIENCNKFSFSPIIGYNTKDCIPDDRYTGAISNLKLYLKSFDMAKLSDEDLKHLKCGQIVVYQNPKTKQNVRGEYIKFVDQNVVEIRLIDVGSIAEVPIHDIYKIKNRNEAEKVNALPPTIFECKLKEIQASCVSNYGSKWSAKAVDEIYKLMDQEVTIDIYSIVANTVIVDLKTIDESQKTETNWNKKLIALGYGQECEESYASKLNHERRMYDFYSLNEPTDPSIEFSTIIDEAFVKTHEMNGPDIDKCDRVINLLGPYSPLETHLAGKAFDITGHVRVDSSSINHVLLNDEILSLHDKLYVAADVTLGGRNQNVKIRETTEMPNIRGLSVLLSMIFSPNVELRRDKDKTRYISLITGLGLDANYGKSYFRERDTIEMIDFKLTETDVADVNSLRFHMSMMLHRDPFHKHPNLNDRQREQTLRDIKGTVMKIINKNREILNKQVGKDNYKWDIGQEDAIRHTTYIGNTAIWNNLAIPPLFEIPANMKTELLSHLKYLENPPSVGYIRECKLCGISLNNNAELNIHLMSKLHLIRKEQIM